MNRQDTSRGWKPNQAGQDELAALLKAYPDIEFVDAAIADINGTLRGKRIAASEALKLFDTGMQLPASLHLMDVRGEMMNPQGRGYSDGDPDGTAWPIAGTAMRVFGSDPPRAQMLMDFRAADGAPLAHDPRAMLERVVSRFRELDLTAVAAHELEFYLIDPKRDARGRPQPPLNPRSGARENAPSVYGLDDLDRYQPFLTALHEAAAMQRVPFSTASKEYAPGQFEANLRHQANAVTASDHAVLLRQIVKAAAIRQNCEATFLAKPYPDKSGSGQHVHVSVIDSRGRNIFDNGTEEGSEMLRFAAGGLAALMAESMAFFAPNLNDYRRFQPDMFAPVNRRWGANNRSCGLRIPVGPLSARRIEHRCAGADANPYLVMAAVLAGVHYGIVNRIDPGPPAVGNVSHEPDAALPFSLEDALEKLERAGHIPVYLGAEGVTLYRQTKAAELQRFRKIISAEEYEWYL
uniref:Gamma-glutamyl-putrescine synthetase n=1 Tax=uncultured bacterium BLR7 TaxID=506523 RepID=C0INP5_9BACT|nr:gamma-glutamyl-putrescine synthetase [uncultured bacterium BLR7]